MAQLTKTHTIVGSAEGDVVAAIRDAEAQEPAFLAQFGPNAPLTPYAVQTIVLGSRVYHLITYIVPEVQQETVYSFSYNDDGFIIPRSVE